MENQHTLNRPLMAAGAIMAFTCALHVFAGGPDIIGPLMRSDIPLEPRATLHVVWHMISVVLGGCGAALFYLARRPNPALWWAVVFCQIAFAALFITITISSMGHLFALPQWTLFAATSALMIWGARR